jgi:hypothetical protein
MNDDVTVRVVLCLLVFAIGTYCFLAWLEQRNK